MSLVHITKMAAMTIYGKNPLKIFSRTKEQMTALGTWAQEN